MFPGDADVERAVAELGLALPERLKPLARIAYDYRWSWSADGAAVFRAIDPDCWERTHANPRRLLTETGRQQLEHADRDAPLVARIERLASELRDDRQRPWRAGRSARSIRWPSAAPSSVCMAPCPSTPAGWASWPATS